MKVGFKEREIIILDKITNFMAEDTVITHIGIRFPFSVKPYLSCSLDRFNTHEEQIKIFFVIYANNEYGIKWQHISYIWEKYKSIIKQKIFLNNG